MDGLPPGLAGYYATQNATNQQNTAGLQQLTGMVGLAKNLRDQSREEQLRQELSGLGSGATDQQITDVARKYADPKTLFSTLENKGVKEAQIKATSERAMATLSMQAQQHEQRMEVARRNASTAEQKAAIDAYDKRFKQSIASAAAQYNLPPDLLGGVMPPMSAPQAPPAAPVPQGGTPTIAPTVSPAEVMAIQDPAERAQAMAALKGGQFSQAPAQGAPAPAMAAPASAPAPVPASAPMAPTAAPMPAQNPAAAPVPAAAVLQPNEAPKPVMPTFTGSRKSIEEQQNKWLAQQAKPAAGGMGNRESVFSQRVITSANQGAKDLANVVQLPLSASTGIFGGRKQGAGLMDATAEVLANKATSQEAQNYSAMSAGFQRSLAAIESAGLMPSGSLTHQMDAVIFKEGDTNLTKMHKLAQTRQIIEAGMEVLESNPRLSESEKGKVREIIATVTKAVPFTHSDLIQLSQAQAINPKATMKDVIAAKSKGDAAPTGVDAKAWKHMTPEERKLFQ